MKIKKLINLIPALFLLSFSVLSFGDTINVEPDGKTYALHLHDSIYYKVKYDPSTFVIPAIYCKIAAPTYHGDPIARLQLNLGAIQANLFKFDDNGAPLYLQIGYQYTFYMNSDHPVNFTLLSSIASPHSAETAKIVFANEGCDPNSYPATCQEGADIIETVNCNYNQN